MTNNTLYTREQATKKVGQIFSCYMESYNAETDTQVMVYYKVDKEQLECSQNWYFLVATGTGFVPFPHIDTLSKPLRQAAYRYMYAQGVTPSECAAIINDCHQP